MAELLGKCSEPYEEYYEDCIKSTFMSGFKRIKVWGAIYYRAKNKLAVTSENGKNRKKLYAQHIWMRSWIKNYMTSRQI